MDIESYNYVSRQERLFETSPDEIEQKPHQTSAGAVQEVVPGGNDVSSFGIAPEGVV